MKLEVSHPEGTPHEVDLPATTVVIGRDPSCDVVLSDNRCSRRHAIIEETADGLTIRDAASANGIFVNGRRLEKSRLRPGDTVRLGDTVIEVLPEIEPTVVVAPEELDFTGSSVPSPPAAPPRRATPVPPAPGPPDRRPPPPPALRPPPRPPSVRRPPPPPVRQPRDDTPDPGAAPPLTVSALALLWALSAPVFAAAGLIMAMRPELGAPGRVLVGAAGLALGSLAAVMAVGLRMRASWARHLQIAVAGIGLLVCPFTFASVTILIYMIRPDVRAAFEGSRGGRAAGAGDAEATFTLSLLGMLGLGLALAAGFVVLFVSP